MSDRGVNVAVRAPLQRRHTKRVRNQAYRILFHPLHVPPEKKKKKTNYTAFILNP